MSMHHGSVECQAPKNCPPFDEPVVKGDILSKTIEVFQAGESVFKRSGKLKILHESADKIVFEDVEGRKSTIYNKSGVIIITYSEIKRN